MKEYEKLIVTCLLAGVLSNNNSWGMDGNTAGTANLEERLRDFEDGKSVDNKDCKSNWLNLCCCDKNKKENCEDNEFRVDKNNKPIKDRLFG